jgi:DNA invertase Pin-like site-specific DNA recombinase
VTDLEALGLHRLGDGPQRLSLSPQSRHLTDSRLLGLVWRELAMLTATIAERHDAPDLSKLFLTIAAAFAEAERDRNSERIGQVKADQKARGRYLPRKMAVYGYCRVSTARQASEGESLDVQRRQIEGYAHMHGLTLRGMTIEEGVSGSIPVHERPKGGPLFAKLRKGDVVIAPKLDRLFRSALDALQVVEDLRKRGVSLHLLDLGGDISGNGPRKLVSLCVGHSR